MIPRRRDRRPDTPIMPIAGNWYGTTLRVYDPVLDAWRIFWSDPATNSFCQQIGKAVGPDIVQEGTLEPGPRSRWHFTKIAARSLHWLGQPTTAHHGISCSRCLPDASDGRAMTRGGPATITGLRGASIWSENVNNLLPFSRDVLGLE